MPYIRNKTYEEFYSYVFSAYTLFATNMERLRITEDELEEFGSKIAAFVNRYFAFTNPALQTDVLVSEMQRYYTEANDMLQQFRRRISSDGNIELTPSDTAELRIKPRPKKYKTAVRPESAPINGLVYSKGLNARIVCITLSKLGTPQARIPGRSMRIERMLAVTDSEAPPAMAEYQSLGFSSRARYTLTFSREQTGKHAHLITAYETATGKRGPWSQPLTFIVQP